MTEIAPPSTPLGQLQRGLGRGFLWALKQKSRTVRPLLAQCVINDPKCDHQLDSRADYYAQLIRAVSMDMSPLERHLRLRDDEDELGWSSSLTVETLGALAKRGSDEAVGILRGYIGSGYHVRLAVEELAGTGNPEAWEGLDQVVSARFQDPEALACKVDWTPLDSPPWNEWIHSPTLLGEILRSRKRRRRKEPEPEYGPMTTDELLDLADQTRTWSSLSAVLLSRDSLEDTGVLVRAVDPARPWRAAAALRALAPQRDPRVLEPARRIIEQWWKRPNGKGQPIVLRMWAARALAELPPELVLPLARRWRSSPQWKFRRTALDILERHATADDVPWIRKQLGRPVTDHRIYAICDYAAMLSKFPEHGPYRAIRRLFREFPYSYGRRFLAESMAATDPMFARGLAYECLWDSEDRVRLVGVRSVDLDLNKARQKVEALAADQWEEPEVREAAQARLAPQV